MIARYKSRSDAEGYLLLLRQRVSNIAGATHQNNNLGKFKHQPGRPNTVYWFDINIAGATHQNNNLGKFKHQPGRQIRCIGLTSISQGRPTRTIIWVNLNTNRVAKYGVMVTV